MKLIIKEGESVDNALQYLYDFLEQYKDDYPILKGNMNVCIDLEGFGHRAYPGNEQELVLDGEESEEILKNRKDKALSEVLCCWKRVLTRNTRDLDHIQRAIRLDKQYLARAEESGKTLKQIESRMTLLSEHEEDLVRLTQENLLLSRFNKALEDNQAKIYYKKRKTVYSSIKYEIECFIVFDNIDGQFGYCDQHGFRNELPYGYKDF